MEKEFTVPSQDDLLFRLTKLDPVDLLSVRLIVDLKDMKLTKELFTFILEKTEVKIGNDWYKVKQEGKQIYNPSGIEERIDILNDICMWFLNNIIKPTFTKSNGSKKGA